MLENKEATSAKKIESGLRTQGIWKTTQNNLPLVSVITVVFNGEKFLEKCIQSVVSQSYQNIEYIVIDGGSSDATLSILKKYSGKIDYWQSEQDNGIYDAMNKGLKRATGDYIAFLNSDDYYFQDALSDAVRLIQKEKTDYSIASVEFPKNQGIYRPIFPLKNNKIYQDMPYPHVGAVIAGYVYKDVGFFDTSYRIAGDHDMALRIHLAGYKASCLQKLVAKLQATGISSGRGTQKESTKVALKHGKHPLLAFLWYYKQVFKNSLARLLPQAVVRIILQLKRSRFR